MRLSRGGRRHVGTVHGFALVSSAFVARIFSKSGRDARRLLHVVLGQGSLAITESTARLAVNGLFNHSMQLSVCTASSTNGRCSVRMRRRSGKTTPRQTQLGDTVFSSHLAASNRGCSSLPRACVVFVATGSILKSNLPICGVRQAVRRAKGLFRSHTRVMCIGNTCQKASRINTLVRSFHYSSCQSVQGPGVETEMGCFGRRARKITTVYGAVRIVISQRQRSTRITGKGHVTLGL